MTATGSGRDGRVRADLAKAPGDVAAMFDTVAPRYDRTNAVLSLWSDRRWREQVRRAADLRPGERVLDLAAGTGTSSVPFAEAGHEVVGCDFSLGMLRVGRHERPELPLVAGDATSLPFADSSIDVVTISFGLRNVSDVPAALAEMRRVTKPFGRLVVCEFSHPTWAPFRSVYGAYLSRVMPLVARVASSNSRAYGYLTESIREWHTQPELARLMREAGWLDPQWRDLTGGVVAVHRAVAPPDQPGPPDPAG